MDEAARGMESFRGPEICKALKLSNATEGSYLWGIGGTGSGSMYLSEGKCGTERLF